VRYSGVLLLTLFWLKMTELADKKCILCSERLFLASIKSFILNYFYFGESSISLSFLLDFVQEVVGSVDRMSQPFCH
jgi:ABC-type thiamin/hydroxymethylpyrimidine transport system permease subunit